MIINKKLVGTDLEPFYHCNNMTVNMTVKEFMDTNALDIVGAIEAITFSGRDFIWTLMENHEREYIQLLFDDHSEHPIQTVHQQIGRYLADHANALQIVCTNEREPSVGPFGNDSSTMIWRKV